MTRRRILVVEDDAPCATMYRAALRMAGYTVDIAGDGVTALRLIEEARPDLIVLDLHLPRLRGEAILSELTATPALRQIPIIIVTGTDAQRTVTRANAILRKPCDPQRLVAIVDEHLEAVA
jgi:DNA-binding response OmpR family regulator